MKTLKNSWWGLFRALWAACLLIACCGAWASDTITYFHDDVLGSPVIATDANGNVLWKENYRPYGDKINNPAAASNNHQWYAGKPFDGNTGLSYMGARYYDPVVGRFMGVDPEGVDPNDLFSFNRYAYANNNPYRYSDPSGRFALAGELVVIAAGTGAAIYYVSLPPQERENIGRVITRPLQPLEDFKKITVSVVKHILFKDDAKEGDEGSQEGKEGDSTTGASGNSGHGDVDRKPSPALQGDPYSPGEVDKRRSGLRKHLGLNADPEKPIPDQGPGRDMGGHEARGRTPHLNGERNVNPKEEHSVRAKGNPIGQLRR